MRKERILELLPNLRQIKSDLKAKKAELSRVSRDLLDLEDQVEDLRDVSVHAGFPIRVPAEETDGSIEIMSAAQETSRYAYISRDSGDNEQPERWRVTAYKNEGSADGTPVAEGVSRRAAVKAGKDYVATGSLTPAGRKSKVSA